MQLGMNYLYPTKVLYSKIKNIELRDEFIQYLFENVDFANPPSEKHGQDLFSSNKNPAVIKWIEEEVTPVFEQYLNESLGLSLSDYNYKYSGWLTGTQGNYNMLLHNHSGATLSAVFYIMAEEQEMGGELVFCDPRINANRGYMREFQQDFQPTRFQPTTNDVIVFPSYLYHFVTPFLSKMRLCVPVDLFLYNEK